MHQKLVDKKLYSKGKYLVKRFNLFKVLNSYRVDQELISFKNRLTGITFNPRQFVKNQLDSHLNFQYK